MSNSRSIIVNECQKGNPLLKYISKVPWTYGNCVPDYQVNQSCSILFLSLKYHRLHPTYIYERIKQLGTAFKTRILLFQIETRQRGGDIPALRELTKASTLLDFTIIVAWTMEEAAKYIEQFKLLEHKSPSAHFNKTNNLSHQERIIEALTMIPSINRTDCLNLTKHTSPLPPPEPLPLTNSLKEIMQIQNPSNIPGFQKLKSTKFLTIINSKFK